MVAALPYRFLADAVLLLHFGVVLFVIGGLVLVVVGNLAGWPWVNRLWFRLAHVAAIAVFVVQAWLGRLCRLRHWSHGCACRPVRPPTPTALSGTGCKASSSTKPPSGLYAGIHNLRVAGSRSVVVLSAPAQQVLP